MRGRCTVKRPVFRQLTALLAVVTLRVSPAAAFDSSDIQRRPRRTVVQGLYSDFQIPAFLMEQRI
jgi:hypothetical protein